MVIADTGDEYLFDVGLCLTCRHTETVGIGGHGA